MSDTAALGSAFGLLTVAATAASGYIVSRRRTSGKIDTSEASTLWVEANNMRKELRDEVTSLRAEVMALRAELTECRTELEAMRAASR